MDDAKRALHIYGPVIESLKGKNTQRKTKKKMDAQRYEISTTIKELHGACTGKWCLDTHVPK